MKYLSLILISMASFSFSLSAGSCSPSAKHNDSIPETKTIYFAGGCFWGTEHFFKQVRGVVATEVGYANGNVEDPSYEEVCSQTTGFAETVRVEYDPSEVSLSLLLDLFFKTIYPRILNR